MSKESKRIQRATERAVKKMEDRRVWIVLTDSIHPPEIRYASLQSIVTPPMAIPKMVTTFTSFSQARDYALGQIMERVRWLQRESRKIRTMKKSEVQ